MLEDYSKLDKLSVNFRKGHASIELSVWPDSETERVYDVGDPPVSNERYRFDLGNLVRVSISPGAEELPPEIVSTTAPSPKFMRFAASLFEASEIFEWECFPIYKGPHMRPFGGARWTWTADQVAPSLVEQQTYMELYKHRAGTLWTIGFWFGTLQIVRCEPMSIEEFTTCYPKRLALKQL